MTRQVVMGSCVEYVISICFSSFSFSGYLVSAGLSTVYIKQWNKRER